MRVSEAPRLPAVKNLVEAGEVELDVSNKRRRRVETYGSLGMDVPGFGPLSWDSNDPETVKDAFSRRLLREVPVIKSGNIKLRLLAFVRRWCEENIPLLGSLMGFDEWLDSCSAYSEPRKQQLRSAHETLRGGFPSRKHASHVDSFVKRETYPCLKAARMINSRCDLFKAWSGPIFKSIERIVYKNHFFIKHIPVCERPAHIRALKRANRRYFMTDYTAFESHFVPEVMDILECVLYRHVLTNFPDEAEFICSVIRGKNRCRTRSGVRATIDGRRMSGDMCTSLGNGFSNLMLALFAASEKGLTLDGFVEGDDGIFAADGLLDAADFERLGFTIKIEEVADPTTASFCGMVFGDDGNIIRDPHKFLQNFGWTSSAIRGGPLVKKALLRAKAMSAICETPQCPIVGAMAWKALEKSAGVTPRFIRDGYHEVEDIDPVKFVAFDPPCSTRVLFERVFGVSISQQLEIERLVRVEAYDEIQALMPAHPDVFRYYQNFVVET